jgi:hypothetical protein
MDWEGFWEKCWTVLDYLPWLADQGEKLENVSERQSDDSQIIIYVHCAKQMANVIFSDILNFGLFGIVIKSTLYLVNSPVSRGFWVESVHGWWKLVGLIWLMLCISFFLAWMQWTPCCKFLNSHAFHRNT